MQIILSNHGGELDRQTADTAAPPPLGISAPNNTQVWISLMTTCLAWQ